MLSEIILLTLTEEESEDIVKLIMSSSKQEIGSVSLAQYQI